MISSIDTSQIVKTNAGLGNNLNKSNVKFQSLLAQTQAADSSEATPEIKKVAKEFESMFIGEMLRPMFEGQEINPEFGGGSAEKVYRSMLVDEYGKVLSNSGGIGLAKNIEQSLMKSKGAK